MVANLLGLAYAFCSSGRVFTLWCKFPYKGVCLLIQAGMVVDLYGQQTSNVHD